MPLDDTTPANSQKFSIRQLRGAYGAGRNEGGGEPKERARKVGGLRGLFFTCDELGWQGVVVEDLPGEWLLVQLYEWVSGGPGDGKLVHFSVAADFEFYFEEDDWRRGAMVLTARADAKRRESGRAPSGEEGV